jgi:hypothetical protein
MALIDKIFGKKKTLSELNRQEIRREEILIGKQRDRLFKRIEQIQTEKQKIFEQGKTQKSPELRKSLALQFEMKAQEQMMVAKELNLRQKEMMTLGRLRMIKENSEKGKALGRLNVTDKDVARISSWIEDDAVTQEMYAERLDQILDLGEQADRDALAGTQLKEAGTEIMNIWNDMDKGVIQTTEEGFEEADKAIRRRGGAMENDM